MNLYTVIRVHRNDLGQVCKVVDTFDSYEQAYCLLSKLNKLYKTESMGFVLDAY